MRAGKIGFGFCLALASLVIGSLASMPVQAQPRVSICTIVAPSTSQDVTAFGVCRRITNNTGKNLCALTGTNDLWTKFRGRVEGGQVANVSMAACPSLDCTAPWGATVLNGNNVTAYSTNSSSNCASVSELRVCTNGVLSGTFTHQTCGAPCSLPWGGTTANGTSVTAYQVTSSPQTYQLDTRTVTPYGGTKYLSTFDDFRGGGYNGISTDSAVNSICNLAGHTAAYPISYACSPQSCTYSTPSCVCLNYCNMGGSCCSWQCTGGWSCPHLASRNNGTWVSPGATGQGWCVIEGVAWVNCSRNVQSCSGSQIRTCNNGTLSGSSSFNQQACP